MSFYEISKIRLEIRHQNTYMSERMRDFLTEALHRSPEASEKSAIPEISGASEAHDMNVICRLTDHLLVPEGKRIIDDKQTLWLNRKDGRGYSLCQWNMKQDKMLVRMDADKFWRNVWIDGLNLDLRFIPEGSDKDVSYMEYYIFQMAGIAFRNHLVHRDGLVIHASCIAYKDWGIMFTAPSGTGKSTHTGIWKKHMGEEVCVLNDDTPAVRMMGNLPYLCGTPWSGTSNQFANKMVPLKAIVVLEQAPFNAIRALSCCEALPRVLPRAFLPYYDRDMMDKANATMDRILKAVPVYLLRCRPDKEAMELVYRCVV